MANAEQIEGACRGPGRFEPEENSYGPSCQDSVSHTNGPKNSQNSGQLFAASNFQENVNDLDLIQQLSGDGDSHMSYSEFFRTHLSMKKGTGSLKNNFTALENLSNFSGKHNNLEIFGEVHDLHLESKSLQQLIEKACKSLSALETKSSHNVANKGDGDYVVTNGYEEKVTELHAIIAELTQKLQQQNNPVRAKEQGPTSEGDRDACSESSNSVESEHDSNENRDSHLQAQVSALKKQMQMKDSEIEELHVILSALNFEFEKSKHQSKCDNISKCSSIGCDNQIPVLKVAERIKLKTMDKQVTGYHISNLGVSRTEVAEHLVSDLTENCDIQELKEKHELEVETERLNAKLEHIRSQNALLQWNFEESKAHCNRLTILIGKYESNIIALKQALDKSEEIIEIYRSLRDVNRRSPKHSVSQDEKFLMNKLSKLLSDQNSIKSTVVKLESHITEPVAMYPASVTDARKLDIETAVLMQELMAIREEKAELKAQLFRLEKEREQLELKLFSQQLQFQAQLNLQSLVGDSCNSDDRKNSIEIRLRERLKEVALALERVTRNAELKQQQLNERIKQLKTVNSVLAHSLEKCNQKLQTRVRKVETQMLSMAERHASQVSNLKQNIISLEDKVAYYENTVVTLEGELDSGRRARS